MSSKNHVRLHAMVEGRVQGVGFRYFVLQNARELGLTGWVRNIYGMKVEVTAEGSEAILKHLVQLLYKGPRSAHVTAVKADWLKATGEFSDFNVSF